MNRNPFVSIIIVNYNKKDYLGKCLDSLKNQTYNKFEVIIVDNGSKDGSKEYLKSNYKDFITLIQNLNNEGFARGNNIGIQTSKGEYIATLNNDTQVDNHWIEELVKMAEKDEKIGMCASKIYYAKQPKTIDSIGVNIYKDGFSKQRGWLEFDKGQYEQEEEILIPSACAALYRRKMLDEIGLFDEDFFAYCEDTDLGFRARLMGWKCVFVPKAIVYHHYSITTGAYSSLKAFLVERNSLWVAVKNFPIFILLCLPFYQLKRYLLVIYAINKKKGYAGKFIEKYSKAKLFLILLKSHIYAVSKILLILKKRKIVQKNKRVSDRTVYSWFKKYGINMKEYTLKG